MAKKIFDLEKEITKSVYDAQDDEQKYADKLFKSMFDEAGRIRGSIPYPDVGPYAVAEGLSDPEERKNLIEKKKANLPYWKKLEDLQQYFDVKQLYCGHVREFNNNYYIMDNGCDTKVFDKENTFLINIDDAKYKDSVNMWRVPKRDGSIIFSRNVWLWRKRVQEVQIVFDKDNKYFSKISDRYLIYSLIKNKDKPGIQSIIQTIQQNQNMLRSLDENRSIIVQGCAGSGKTTVLLHRLRYFLYNDYANDDNYVLLTPGKNFKEFISEATKDFYIKPENILSYQEYYRLYADEKSKVGNVELDERVFPPQFLEAVYSKKIVQNVYPEIFNVLEQQTEKLLELSKEKIELFKNDVKEELETQIEQKKKALITIVESLIEPIKDDIVAKIDNKYENIFVVAKEVVENYQRKKAIMLKARARVDEKELSVSEELDLYDERIVELNKEITKTRGLLLANPANAAYYRAKEEELLKKKAKLIEELKENYLRERNKETEKYINLYGNLSEWELDILIDKLNIIVCDGDEGHRSEKFQIETWQHWLSSDINLMFGHPYLKKIRQEVCGLQDALKELKRIRNNNIELLVSAGDLFYKLLTAGDNLLSYYAKGFSPYFESIYKKRYCTEEEKEKIKKELTVFYAKDKNDAYLNLYRWMFQKCRNEIFREFGIKLNDNYKHYWFLKAYCKYLTNNNSKQTAKKYVFIDEAQDLSIAELELIQKINTAQQKPKINLFGDIDQNITAQGIKKWADVGITRDIYSLNENFRNTNQIVKYCNEKLKMQMQPVGVDMDEVSEYKDIFAAIDFAENIKNDAVFIVKDEYAEADLENLLKGKGIENYHIYTVKTVKGLEFKETFVFDDGMQRNEKYIAYTRALAKLNVIKNLPKSADREKITIVQGTDEM